MPFAMPRQWKTRSVDQGVEMPRTVYFEGETYANVKDLRHVLNFRQKRVRDNGYRVAMMWMRDLLGQLLGDDEND
jgi:hypothetical protein